jgi:nicotinate-nucleotide pyrophosphorylase (carboxylating)
MVSFHTAKLIRMALQEDLGTGDVTTDHLVAPDAAGVAKIIAKEPITLCGLDVARQVFAALDPDVEFMAHVQDARQIDAGAEIATIRAAMRALLSGERTALNFLQRLSGVATHVRRYVEKLPDRRVRLVDTRKTTPGWRVLEKYAVRCGGAGNHRMGLADGVLIKDNHIVAAGGISAAIEKIRGAASHLMKIEIEVSNLAEAMEAVENGADIIMLDNMGLAEIRQAVDKINGRAEVEVSGGIQEGDLDALSRTGVDIISVGALTHAARSVDISMRIARDPS